MYVRVRLFGKPEQIIVLPSKLSKIEEFRKLIHEKLDVSPELQRLFYGGKLLEDGYSMHDYNIKLNDVIQVMLKATPTQESSKETKEETKAEKETNPEPAIQYEKTTSTLYRVGELIDVRETVHKAWFEGKIDEIVINPEFQSLYPENKTKASNGISVKSVDEINNEKEKISKAKDEKQNDLNDADDRESSRIENGKSSPSKNRVTNGDCNSPSTSKNKKAANSISPNGSKSPLTTPKRNGIKNYFSIKKDEGTVPEEKVAEVTSEKKTADSETEEKINEDKVIDEDHILFKVLFEGEDEASAQYCTQHEIRPRSRKEIEYDDLQINQTVLLNHNTEEPSQIGLWYDFTIKSIKKLRRTVELTGTLYHGADVPLDDTKIKCLDKVYEIEKNVPLKDRSEEFEKLMITPTEKRKRPLQCSKCKDDPNVPCRECACHTCAGKNDPELTVLCDECNMGYHMACLMPPLTELPSEDWYCPQCKREPTDVIAPGGGTQARKPNQSKSKRDWGKGMACMGKTTTCTMPPNHFGPIPGVEVGMSWRFRIQISETGVHRPPVSGIHGRDVEGAYSIVLSGGYEDDYDNGFEFTYTGSGGRDLSGNKRTADQSKDQTLTRENRALARNCAVKVINDEDGADAGSNWKEGKPVRVVRSYKMQKHFPQFAPKEGIRYDGIYKIVKYYPETGKSGFRVWKYLLRRDDPSPAPWEKNAKQYSIKYPPGHLEAEAEKKAQKEKLKQSTGKKVLKESNGTSQEVEEKEERGTKRRRSKNVPDSPPVKKIRTRSSNVNTEDVPNPVRSTPKRKKETSDDLKSPELNGINPFTLASAKKSKKHENGHNKSGDKEALEDGLSKDDREIIKNDTLNNKLWEECLSVLKEEGKQGLVDKVTTLFMCIICQDVAANPITTSCSHNFCSTCLKLAFKNTGSKACPHCRSDLSKDELECNEKLKSALRLVLPGYDLAKK